MKIIQIENVQGFKIDIVYLLLAEKIVNRIKEKVIQNVISIELAYYLISGYLLSEQKRNEWEIINGMDLI